MGNQIQRASQTGFYWKVWENKWVFNCDYLNEEYVCVADGERQIVGCFLLKFLSVYLDVCYVLYSALIRRVEALDISMFTIMLFPLSHYSNVSQI